MRVFNKAIQYNNHFKNSSMTKMFFYALGFTAILASCSQKPAGDANTEQADTTTMINLKDFQAKGAEYLNREIRTTGIVDHVCKHGGKKILLVADDASVHVFNKDRFEESIVGKEVEVKGIVKEDRTDEAALLKIEEDAINAHSEGEEAEAKQERMIQYVNMMRDSLKKSGVDHFSEYYLDFVSIKNLDSTTVTK